MIADHSQLLRMRDQELTAFRVDQLEFAVPIARTPFLSLERHS
jgi:hypothetical protein